MREVVGVHEKSPPFAKPGRKGGATEFMMISERVGQPPGADTKDLKFNVDKRSDNAAARRGREQMLHDKYKPPMNKIRPISPKNPNRAKYMREAKKLGD